jgi:DNA-binding transcriptional MerR regulator
MRIGDLSSRTGTSIRSIRYYEQMGLLPATRRANGYREFPDTAVERVRVIRELLEAGFTVEEIASLAGCLQADLKGTRCGAQTAALYRKKLERIEAQMRTLQTLRERIRTRLATLQPN